jgi:hypothetical protein
LPTRILAPSLISSKQAAKNQSYVSHHLAYI